MRLVELRTRHEHRKLINAPLDKLLGASQQDQDLESLLEMAESMRETLRDCHAFLRTHYRNDDEFNELITTVGMLSE